MNIFSNNYNLSEKNIKDLITLQINILISNTILIKRRLTIKEKQNHLIDRNNKDYYIIKGGIYKI